MGQVAISLEGATRQQLADAGVIATEDVAHKAVTVRVKAVR
jgi:hypothetical protein